MTISLRLDDALLVKLDAAAAAANMSRSAYLKSMLATQLEAAPAPVQGRVADSQDRVEFKLRLHRAPFEAVKRAAAREHILPSDIIRRIVHAHFYAGKLKAVYHREARQALKYVAGGLARIGTNVNQSANAMHRAVGQSDDASMLAAAVEMKVWAGEISVGIDAAVEHCRAVAAADGKFWRDEATAMKLKNKTQMGVT